MTGVEGSVLSAEIVQAYEPRIGRVPAAYSQLPSPDGAIQGLLDQVKGQLKSKDELVKDVLETAAQAAYSPFEQLGIMNPDTPPGPDVIYNHDPSMDGKSFIRRVQPSEFVQLPMVLGFLEDQTRAQLVPCNPTG